MIDPPPEPHLVLRTGTEDHCISLTNGNQWTIGRSDNNHLVIKDHCISRIHAILQRMDNGDFYLIDLGSRNGSFVNGRWANIPVKLRNQD
ncbi:MAG: FHA domain-containing protein [Synechococcales cyanobacterium]